MAVVYPRKVAPSKQAPTANRPQFKYTCIHTNNDIIHTFIELYVYIGFFVFFFLYFFILRFLFVVGRLCCCCLTIFLTQLQLTSAGLAVVRSFGKSIVSLVVIVIFFSHFVFVVFFCFY